MTKYAPVPKGKPNYKEPQILGEISYNYGVKVVYYYTDYKNSLYLQTKYLVAPIGF